MLCFHFVFMMIRTIPLLAELFRCIFTEAFNWSKLSKLYKWYNQLNNKKNLLNNYRLNRAGPSSTNMDYYTPHNKVRGGILDSPCLSVCPSVRLSICLSVTFRVRPVASTVQDGFFPYLEQVINSMRGCVACDDLWPWPISSRSFGLDLENRVRSVASTVLDGFFLYLAQMITIIRGCVACYVFFRIWKFEFLANFWNFSALTLKKKICSSWCILSIFSTNDH